MGKFAPIRLSFSDEIISKGCPKTPKIRNNII